MSISINVNVLAYYCSMVVYLYYKWNGNTEMINSSFHVAVLLGILALLNHK